MTERPPPAGGARRPLVIAAFGSSTSAHVRARVKAFADRGHRVVLFCDTVAGLPGVVEVPVWEYAQDDLPRWVRTLERTLQRFVHRTLGILLVFFALRQRVRRLAPDILHVHYAYSIPAWMVPALRRRPLVVSIMGGDVLFEEQGSPTVLGRQLTTDLLSAADVITSKSDFLITVLDRLGGFGRKAMKVVWGVDLRHFRRVDASDLRARFDIPASAPVVLSPKILQPFYNIDLIVEALPMVVAACPDVIFVVTEYGADAAYRERLEGRVRDLGIERNVRFVGHVAHQDMPRFYSLASVAVAVPPSDGLPQTLLEGLACGVPNVLSRLPRYEEVVQHGETAWFVDMEPAAIGDGIVFLLRDETLRRRMASDGRALVEREADFEREVRRVEDAYYTQLERRARPAGPLAALRALRGVWQYTRAAS